MRAYERRCIQHADNVIKPREKEPARRTCEVFYVFTIRSPVSCSIKGFTYIAVKPALSQDEGGRFSTPLKNWQFVVGRFFEQPYLGSFETRWMVVTQLIILSAYAEFFSACLWRYRPQVGRRRCSDDAWRRWSGISHGRVPASPVVADQPMQGLGKMRSCGAYADHGFSSKTLPPPLWTSILMRTL